MVKQDTSIKFNVSPLQRGVLLVCLLLLSYIVASVASGIILSKGLTPGRIVISTVIQDLIVFIVPAVVTAVMITRQPAEFLTIQRNPKGINLLLAILTLLFALPVMNVIIQWNETLTFPDSMEALTTWLREMEDSAANTISVLINGDSVLNLIVVILVIGVFAGFSEELFFRGTLQRLLITSNVNPHLAIWLTAILFSAFHLQFFGFVPRLLLGAMFGYFVWWSGSVWLSVAAHVFNNTLAALSLWSAKHGSGLSEISKLDTIGSDDMVITAVGLILTAATLTALYFQTHPKRI